MFFIDSMYVNTLTRVAVHTRVGVYIIGKIIYHS